MQEAPSPGPFRRHATLVKMAGIAGLALVLLVPLGLVGSILHERLHRRDQAAADITRTWGSRQEIVGPVLVVPVRGVGGAQLVATFLPATLAIDSQVEPQTRRRGIYEAVVYRARLAIEGTFAAPNLAALSLTSDQLAWSEAWVAFTIPD